MTTFFCARSPARFLSSLGANRWASAGGPDPLNDTQKQTSATEVRRTIDGRMRGMLARSLPMGKCSSEATP